MRLSRLHIAGFKSFPDRSELGFDRGVTAIVGPNGCGKSNVVDAITWVLGEQSAKSLRGERMEDVIFNGSEARKPTAAAEVRLKFTQVARAVAAAAAANADRDELLDAQPLVTRDVEIGRRLYRSGESEYLIDGEVCRLRDVHDLLMDSGLGVKAYAVIEQGKIGQILSSRPAERRTLIEEAAGVTKYKSRRRAAELKLEAAQQNLTRIDDIVFEVEKQLGALKRQAARARRYKRLREELRKWEQVQFARRYEALAAAIAAAEYRLEEARVRDAAAAAHVAALESALGGARIGFAEAEAQAVAARERAHARELEIGRRQQQIEFDSRQIEDLAQQAAAFAAEADELEARREPARQVMATQRDAALRARQTLEGAEARVRERESGYADAIGAVQAVERDADTVRAALMAASTTLSALRQARDHAAAGRERIAAERERLDIEARDLAAEADRGRQAHAAAQAALERGRAEHAETVARRGEAEVARDAARRDRERLVQERGARERALAGAGARLRSLEELEARRATFGDAARLLLADTGGRVRQHGAVADHLQVERSFERAVDALLGDLLQYVLVEGPDDVGAALERIGEQNAGRAGLVVLSALTDQPPASALETVPEGARTLLSVVGAAGVHGAAILPLVGQALIVESLDRARALAGAVSVPVATLAGEVFRGPSLVQGGPRQDAHGILETRAEILTLRDDVAAAGAAIAALAAQQAELDGQIQEAERTVSTLVAEQHDREKTIVGVEAQVARAADDVERLTRRINVVSTERGRADDEQASTERRHDETVAAIQVHEGQQQEAESDLAVVIGRLQTAREAAEAASRLVTESRTEQAALFERALALDADVARLEEAARDLDARVSGRRADIERTAARRDQLHAAIVEARHALDEDVLVLDGLKVTMRELDERVASLRDELLDREQEIRGARGALDEVRAEVVQLEVARATAAADLSHLSAGCFEAVGATLDQVREAVAELERTGDLVAPSVRTAPDDDEGEAGEGEGPSPDAVAAADDSAADASGSATAGPVDPERIIAELRRKIERLGPVNMMAIEQFDELETRHTFLTSQRQDLLDSIAQTGEAIRKIDKTTRERFAEAFESINRHFERTFTTLFGGGRAGLVLIDQENEQESGIDIIAQPPGKRLQNVQLLSGGEKALTAMALMFAIFKHRPSPFCLLDEIDAPLDDANIGRFVEMLQGMQEHTQFILITHNRKTMEIADRLYGVTMEEPGVSKLISVQFN
jgi:chromosome segregation protein